MSLELSIWSGYYYDLSPEKALARLKKRGVTVTELSDDHGKMLIERPGDPREIGRAFGAYARELGMTIPQGHLWLGCRLVSNPDAVEILKKWIDLYEAIGIKNMVLHLDVYNMEDKSIAEIHAANLEKLKEIDDYITGRNIRICLENLFRRGIDHIDQLLMMLERIGSDQFGITLDTGHLNIVKTTSQRDFILAAGSALHALHINDNEGEKDQHLMPFGRGTVDFAEVIAALKEIGYNGIFNYELPGEALFCPLMVRDRKLRYIKEGYRYLMKA